MHARRIEKEHCKVEVSQGQVWVVPMSPTASVIINGQRLTSKRQLIDLDRLLFGARGRKEGRKEGRKDGWMDGRMDGRKDGWMDGWMEGWMEGRKEGKKEVPMHVSRVSAQS